MTLTLLDISNDVRVPGMKVSRETIARAGLRLLDKEGIDGLTMRSIAAAVGVRAPTLYWHVNSKRALLDAMADVIAADAAKRVRPRRAEESLAEWLAETAQALRAAMLQHRDGARVFVGSYTPSALPINELVLQELTAAGFPLELAALSAVTLLHYTTGYVIEEQAQAGKDYPRNPYATAETIDPQYYPLTAQALQVTFNPDGQAGFQAGLELVLAGILAAVGQ